MIPRYTRKQMGTIWEPENRFRTWLAIEICVCEALAKLGEIPQQAVKNIKKKADFDIDRIDEIERETKHDVIAFLTSVSEYVGEDSRYIHLGLTSSDILDTSFSLLLKEAGEKADNLVSAYDFTKILHDHLDHAEKASVVELLWKIAYADGGLDMYENSLVLKISDLLHVSRGRVMRLKHDAGNQVS